MKIIIILILLLFNGCAAQKINYQTTDVMVHIKLYEQKETSTICNVLGRVMPREKEIRACAEVDFKSKICTIYISPDSSRWILAHELLHCIMGQYH